METLLRILCKEKSTCAFMETRVGHFVKKNQLVRFPRVLLKQNSRSGGGTCRCSQNVAARGAAFCGCIFVARAWLATLGGEVFLAFPSFTLSVSHLSSSVFICVKPESQLALWWAGLQGLPSRHDKHGADSEVKLCCSRVARNLKVDESTCKMFVVSHAEFISASVFSLE